MAAVEAFTRKWRDQHPRRVVRSAVVDRCRVERSDPAPSAAADTVPPPAGEGALQPRVSASVASSHQRASASRAPSIGSGSGRDAVVTGQVGLFAAVDIEIETRPTRTPTSTRSLPSVRLSA